MKVRERKAVDAWARYCLEKEEVDKISEVKAPKILNDVEIQSVIESAISRKPAPFLGPARKFSKSFNSRQ